MIACRSDVYAAMSFLVMIASTLTCSMLYEYPALETETGAAACSDGNDNDLDGKVDCDDLDCIGACNSVCPQYCDVVMRACTNRNAVYVDRATCLGVCDLLPKGDPMDPTGTNTVACRKQQADLAESSHDPAAHCSKAGPGGAGACGTNCAGYCAIFKRACPTDSAWLTRCEEQCSPLRDTGGLEIYVDRSGDTVQCRLVQASSATVDAHPYCQYAQLLPTGPWCINNPIAPPECQDFCRLTGATCTGDLAVYESTLQCLAFCSNFPSGTNSDRVENTIGCRVWHTYNAMIDPTSQCPHTGPGGDGHCGVDVRNKTGNCESYCLLLEKACAAGFAASYPDQAACQTACSNMPDEFGAKSDSRYRVATAQTGNTLACRTLHATRALTDKAECLSALGDGMCR